MARFFVEDDRIINVDEITHVVKQSYSSDYLIYFRNGSPSEGISGKTYEALRAFIKGLGQAGTV